MSRLYQIYEDDLTELERLLPSISNELSEHLNPRLRSQLQRVKRILSDVRWNYGPHTDVERIPVDDKS